MPLDRALVRDSALLLVVGSVASLPFLQLSQSHGPASLRSQARDLSRALTKAVALVLGGTGALVLVTGVVVGGERAWGRLKGWWTRGDAAGH
ncbi:hypothetical protein JCM10207_008400 [Rhodosporidiobolus poonsookiae]